MSDINQRLACKAVIVHEGKVLVMREAGYDEGTSLGKWECPGGRINPGEPAIEGLHREILEETGLNVSVGDPLDVSDWFPVIHGQKNHIVAIFFACTATTDQVKLSEEHDEYRWISVDEVAEIDMLWQYTQAIEKYFARNTA